MRNTFPYLLLALFSFYGCSDDVNCVEEPDDPDCVASCMDDPTLPGCGDMGPGDMGMGDAGPCGMCTGGDVCDEASGSCVACLGDGDCGDDVCLVDAADSANNECVGCVDSEDCSGALGTCDEENHECVGCLMDSDCDDPEASACNTDTNMCEGCSNDDQCMRLTATPVCDEAGETCVQCAADDESACGTNVCDVEMGVCTEIGEGTALLCQECVSDRQCADGRVCVEMSFEDTDVGHFCLWRRDADTAVGAPNGMCGNSRPYVSSDSVTTISGTSTEICTLARTTCEALSQFREESCTTPGTTDDECGVVGLEDGLCRFDMDLGNRCTVPCGSSDDCETGFSCNAGETPRYCNLVPD